jgi:hypothetical protein
MKNLTSMITFSDENKDRKESEEGKKKCFQNKTCVRREGATVNVLSSAILFSLPFLAQRAASSFCRAVQGSKQRLIQTIGKDS